MDLKSKRTPTRRLFTRKANELKQLISDKASIDKAQVTFQLMEAANKRLQVINQQIYDELVAKEECTEDNLYEEEVSVEEYDMVYQETCLLYDKFIQQIAADNAQEDKCSVASYDTNTSQDFKFQIKKLDLKKFDLSAKTFMAFWAQFESIHSNDHLKKTIKFQYLLNCLEEGTKARKNIDTYFISDDNYDKVITHIQERYGRNEMQRALYINELVGFTHKVTMNPNNFSLSDVHEKFSSTLRVLETLGLPSENFAFILIPMILPALPTALIKKWHDKRADDTGEDNIFLSMFSGNDNPLESLMTFIGKQVTTGEDLEVLQLGTTITGPNYPGRSRQVNSAIDDGLDYITNSCPTAMSLVSTVNNSNRNDSAKQDNRRSIANDNANPSDGSKAPSRSKNQGRGNDTPRPTCVFCNGLHISQDCITAQSKAVENLKKSLTDANRCFSCFKVGHQARACRTRVRCIFCGGTHFILLCEKVREQQALATTTLAPHQTSLTAVATTSAVIHLRTMQVMCCTDAISVRGRVLMDDASQRSYISRFLVEALGLQPVGQEWLSQIVFGNIQGPLIAYDVYELTIRGINTGFIFPIRLLAKPELAPNLPCVAHPPVLNELKERGIVLTETSNDSTRIDILIGADNYSRLLTGRLEILQSGISAMETKLGWNILGPVKSSKAQQFVASLFVGTLPDLWDLDTLGIQDSAVVKSKDEVDTETINHFHTTTHINAEGRYEVELPWRTGHPPLLNNFDLAVARLKRTTSKLKAADLYVPYDEVFNEWLRDGIIEEAPNPPSARDPKVHYLPHQPVIKDYGTTKIRPVFDASAIGRNKISLNSCLNPGPNLIHTIPDILRRFRTNIIGVSADIKKAFLQISVRPQDRDVMRFLWRKPESTELTIYRHKRVVFGLTSSPFQLGATLNYHLDQVNSDEYADIVPLLKKSIYVDNLLTSVKSDDEYLQVKDHSSAILSAGKFELRSWVSNGSQDYPPNDESADVRVLGLRWDVDSDTLFCAAPKIDDTAKLTKRQVLSVTNSIYDPTGFLSPITIVGKIILQDVWQRKLTWQEELPPDLAKRFRHWLGNLKFLPLYQLPRCVTIDGIHGNCQLHVFSDGSQRAYAGCVFLRAERFDSPTDVKVTLLDAKARVAPIPSTSIPRLELLGALIAVRLYDSVRRSFDINLQTFFWTDSMVALAWITTSTPWGCFVGNRVKEIRQKSDITAWRHLPGHLNPADLPSRGAVDFSTHEWQTGPDWLYGPPDSWPKSSFEFPSAADDERRKTAFTAVNVPSTEPFSTEFSRFSEFKTILRVCGWVLRFIGNTRRRIAAKNTPELQPQSGDLTSPELISAERKVVFLIQKDWSIDDQETRLGQPRRNKSSPGFRRFGNAEVKTDENGLLRIRTKLTLGCYREEFQEPFILPHHPITEKIVVDRHLRLKHAGVQTVLNSLREEYWIPQGRRYIRQILRKCVLCRRYGAHPIIPAPAPLPPSRIECGVPFQTAGVDLGGPLMLRDGQKAWIVLVTCAVYRAVHLELVTELSTPAFIQAFRRFIARRGRSHTVYSDNGTNFVGTDNALNQLDWDLIKREMALIRIDWHFNPPAAPWWGGFWERMIGVVKSLLRKSLGKASLDYQEMTTVLCECENVINDRPLTYLYDDPNEMRPLTPNTFLRQLATAETTDFDMVSRASLIHRVRYVQEVQDNLKKRFQNEYLGALVQTPGIGSRQQNLQVGDVVLVKSKSDKRILWPMAKVLELIPGRDGVHRTARLKLASTTLVRAVNCLYPLELSTSEVSTPATPSVPKGPAETPKTLSGTPTGNVVDIDTRVPIITTRGRVIKPPQRLDM